MYPRRSLLACLLLALTSAAVLSAQTDYEIKFARKAQAGDRFRVVSTGFDEQVMQMQFNGKDMPARQDGYQFEVMADCEVLAVTDRGREQKVQLTIGKLARTLSGPAGNNPPPGAVIPAKRIDGLDGEILPAGTVVTAERINGRMKYTAEGNPVVPMVAKVLDAAAIFSSGERDANVEDDNIMGSGTRRKVGETWSINSAAAAASLAKRGIQTDAEHVHGTVTLVEATQDAGEPALRISAQFEVSGLKPPLPAGVEVDRCELTSRNAGLFPVDPAKGRLMDAMTLAMTVTAHGNKDGNSVGMLMTKKTIHETKFIRN